YGGAFLTICDSGARFLFYPYEVPVGLIMSVIGAPFFVFLLMRRKRMGHE
ncbi:MAG: iron chelate uptake ABC transporter family permease subunit, partial [Lachnospiraceae bacterium]|nr:iron chelate uptake ABC transporter family permease subunit [Lachnospiraceae bacterium]